MKRKYSSSDSDNNYPASNIKKRRECSLSEGQKRIAEVVIPELLAEGSIHHVKSGVDILFNTPKKVDHLLGYTNYKPFLWAIEHDNLELMEYFINRATERGKFLLVCHNNYEVIEQFIDLIAEKINKGYYRREITTDILKLFISIKPLQTIEAIEHIFESIGGETQKVVRILKINLQDAIDKLAKEDNKDIKEYLEEKKGEDKSTLESDRQSTSERKFTAKLNSSDDKSFCSQIKQNVSFVIQL
ncbi:hypothetical protein I862_07465 [endosymbiont of Acanthamoeba sp. UWC8]|uniref:hypothetical protein n=1 Tax=endosymbiont of Acanthamoeba sp. UWC8 TaxID=86106 RepID=UPI0004D1BBAD|nr:hypothetical protein [endosymbiont of Acanthamoeba sp. UWC8]AIF82047.1 hypothetical protein I862_07465 [endosymbiont of Acanthamoeba sp. UWC8]